MHWSIKCPVLFNGFLFFSDIKRYRLSCDVDVAGRVGMAMEKDSYISM